MKRPDWSTVDLLMDGRARAATFPGPRSENLFPSGLGGRLEDAIRRVETSRKVEWSRVDHLWKGRSDYLAMLSRAW